MLKTLLLLCFLSILCSGNSMAQIKKATVHTYKDLKGKWKSNDPKEHDYIEFKDSTTFMFMKSDNPIICQYEVNFETTPIQLKINTEISGIKHSSYGLLQFLNNNTIKFQMTPTLEKVFNKYDVNKLFRIKIAR